MRVLFIRYNSRQSKQIGTILSEVGIKTDNSFFDRNTSQVVRENTYDLIIIDSSYQNLREVGIIGSLRKDSVSTPIILLSADFCPRDKIELLDAGADACLDLPCPHDLLIAYINAIIRRDKYATTAKLIQIEQLSVDTRSCSVRINGKQISLTADEYKLLLLLAEHKGVAVSTAMISKGIHNHDNHFGESNIPAVLIHRIRKKIKAQTNQNYIKTVKGAGYMLCSPGEAPR